MKFTKLLKNGIVDENPVLVQVIGMCPTLGVTTSAINGLGMALSTTCSFNLFEYSNIPNEKIYTR